MLIFQSLKYQGCGNHQQQPKNAMDATTVNMEPGTTTLMQSTAVTQVGSLGPINYPSSGICSLFFLPKLPCLTPLKGFLELIQCPSRALNLGSCIASVTSGKQSHCQVWSARRGGPRTQSKTTQTLIVFLYKLHLFMPILDCGKQRRIESVMILAFPQVNGSGGGNGSDPGGDKVKRLSAIADRVGCNLVQLQLAWQLRNQVRPLMHFFLYAISRP